MDVFLDAWNRDDLPSGTVATIGNFDGLHLGQQAIIASVVERAEQLGLMPVVVTFEPHPLQILRPENAPPRLTTMEQKIELLGGCGVGALIVVSFDQRFSLTAPEEFVRRLLFARLDVRELLVGSRFVFGRDRTGDVSLISKLAAADGRRVVGVLEVEEGGEPVSSTRVRAAISRGAVEEAARLLGRPYRLSGRVIHGDAMGRALGWPTINLDVDNELLPAFGVYRSRVGVRAEAGDHSREPELLPAVTNVGLRPTLHTDSAPTVESHILDFSGSLYGHMVIIELLDRLRGERQFSSREELKEQIARDVKEARRRFSALLSG